MIGHVRSQISFYLHGRVIFSGAPSRSKRAWDRAPYSQNMVNLFSFGCHVTDRAYVRTYASTDYTGRVGETIKRKGGVSQVCLGKPILAIHNMVNWQLSKQDSHWPVSHCHIGGSCVNSSRWRDLFESCPLTSCFTSSQSMFNLILSS